MTAEHEPRTFKYKLDFYYQQTVIYLVTLLLYMAVRGSVTRDRLTITLVDPIGLTIAAFCLAAIAVLALNLVRGRKLTVGGGAIVFRSRFRVRRVELDRIEWMHIGRESFARTAGRMQYVVFKVKGQRPVYRIRIGRYERSHELLAAMDDIIRRVPERKHLSIFSRRPLQRRHEL